MIVFVGAVVIGATGAFFSDTETSTGNTFTAGAIDLGIDNESYYNGVLNLGTSWELDFDIDSNNGNGDVPRQLFNFSDLKPGDYGEDTISIHVNNNESWMCADVTLTSNDDATCNEPENDVEGTSCALGSEPDGDFADGDLAQNIEFLWWADDGDNVLEDNEEESVISSGPLGALGVDNTATVDLADDDDYIWSTFQGPLGGLLTDDEDKVVYIGKAWCFGDIAPAPLEEGNYDSPADNNDDEDGAGRPEDGGYTCSGASSLNNASQTDSATMNVSFRAVQARNNAGFECNVPND